MMNDFFTSVGPNLASNMNDPWVYNGNTGSNAIDNIFTDNVEVLKYLKETDTSKASSVPNVSSKILKPALISLIDELTYIFNLCLSSNTFPRKWKIASVVPLQKDGDLSQCTNYRPISLLPIPGKILEQIIHDRLTTHCDNNDLLNENQGGFRKGHSTVATLSKFTDNMYKAIDNNQISIATYINFSKAFDTINHQILLLKLERLGIKGNTKI